MSIRKLDQVSFDSWVNTLIAQQRVFGVQAKGGRFVFDTLTKAENLRLDYDVTILPPKKYFLPQREDLMEFHIKGQYKSNTEKEPFILLGVHPYDVIAISQMDKAFSADNYDVHYMSRRQNATIIACDVFRPSANVFAGCMNSATVESGFDILLTKIGEYYLADARTPKGEALLKLAQGEEPAEADLGKREQVWKQNIRLLRKHKLKGKPEELADLLEKTYYDPIWEEKAKLCFSCGSCNLVCPTCYCFDVQDDINWDLQTGKRTRAWDGCLLRDFAAVAGGHNFRRQRADRYRHRYYRKGKYIAEKLGQVSCVGCGRCIDVCVSGIANPVEVYNRLFMSQKNIYVPEPATILKKYPLTSQEMFYELKLDSGHDLDHEPGQFVEVSLPGIGEAPISVSSSPTQTGTFQLVVRKVGNVTTAMSRLHPGDKVGVRGPFGTQFPVHDVMKGKDILFICGGIGLVPVRSAIRYIMDYREDYGKVIILYGMKSPAERLFANELEEWSKIPGVEVMETVDNPDENWQGNVGVITTLIPKVNVDSDQTIAVICGPPVMYRFVLEELQKLNVPDNSIYLSLERRMKCGVGKCGHCQMNEIYVCQEGPVFKYSDIKDVMEAI